VQIELLRQAPAWRKLDMVGQLNQTLRTLALSGLRQRHPQATPQELRRRPHSNRKSYRSYGFRTST